MPSAGSIYHSFHGQFMNVDLITGGRSSYKRPSWYLCAGIIEKELVIILPDTVVSHYHLVDSEFFFADVDPLNVLLL